MRNCPCTHRLNAVEIGEKWAYRERGRLPTTAVTIVAKSQKPRPTRIKVRFEDDQFEGAEEWTPIVRLRCSWEEKNSFLQREAELDALINSANPDDTEVIIGDEILRRIATDISYLDPYKHGILQIPSVTEACALLGWEPEKLLEGALLRDGQYLVPWRTSRKMIETLLRKFPSTTQQMFTEYKEYITEARNAEMYRQMLNSWAGEAEQRFEQLNAAERDSYGTDLINALKRLSGDGQAQLAMELDELRTFKVGALAALRDAAMEIERSQSQRAAKLRSAIYDLLDREQANLIAGIKDRPVDRYLR